MLNFAEQTGSGAVIMVWSFLSTYGLIKYIITLSTRLAKNNKKIPVLYTNSFVTFLSWIYWLARYACIWARCCNLRDSVRRMVEILGDICQWLMAVPQGSLGDVWVDRTIIIVVVGDESKPRNIWSHPISVSVLMVRWTSFWALSMPILTVGGLLGSCIQHLMAFIMYGPAALLLIAFRRVSLASYRVLRALLWEQVSMCWKSSSCWQ